MKFELNLSKKELTIISLAFITLASIFVMGSLLIRNPDTTADADKHGWSADAAEEAAPIVAAMPAFGITGENGEVIVQSNEKANARLWDAVLAVNDGKHLPNVAQLIGDCVSRASMNASEYLICIEMKTGPPGQSEFHRIFSPYPYGVSRFLIGKGKLRGDGSCGAWAAKGVVEYGLLRADAEGVPPYSASVARDWGRNGPPQRFVEEGRHFPIKQASPVRTADEIRDAICNGYPVTIASNVGFEQIVTKDDRLVGARKGTWNHAMTVCGYDGQTGAEPYWYILNSWGELAHGKPLQGEPPGGFWIRERDMQAIAVQGDSFAYSGFEGFKGRSLNFHLFGEKKKEPDHAKRISVDTAKPRNGNASVASRSTGI